MVADVALPGQPLDSERTEVLSTEPTPQPAPLSVGGAKEPASTRAGRGHGSSSTDVEAAGGETEGSEALLDGSYFPRYRFSRFTGAHQYLCFGLYVPFGVALFALRTLVSLCMLLWVGACCCCGRRAGHSSRGCSVHHATISAWRWMMVSVKLNGDRRSRPLSRSLSLSAPLLSFSLPLSLSFSLCVCARARVCVVPRVL